jgi:hypothetical protein
MNLRIALLSLGLFALSTGIAVPQTPRTGKLMREKLAHSQTILEALTTSNQDVLIREADALSRIAASPQWTADLRTPELRGYSESFVRTVTELAASARRRDLDAAAVNYNAMVTACYQCHKHLKSSRIAK